jgi:hypothetical protein
MAVQRFFTASSRIVVPTVTAAAIASAIDLPRSSLAGALLIVAMLMPMMGAWVLAAELLRLPMRRLERRPRLVAAWLTVAHAAIAPIVAGIILTDFYVVDWPFGKGARVAYAATLLAALAAGVLSRRAIPAVVRGIERLGVIAVIGLFLVADGIAVAFVDDYAIRSEMALHGWLFRTLVAGLAVGASFVAPRRPRRLLDAGCALVAAIAVAFAVVPRDRTELYRKVAFSRGMHGRVLTMVRGLVDRDGDGFSALFDGGDCDDHDAGAYPLSPQRDCLGWRAGAIHKPRVLPRVVPRGDAPRLLLLITIDAFRCGFGVREKDPIRNACPVLTRLAAEGQSRLDAHASAPNTSSSLTILMTGSPNSDPRSATRKRPPLSERLREAGYRTDVVMTFPQILLDARTRASFDVVDNQLRTDAQSPFRADDLTALTLRHARQALADPTSRTFLWAHYPDPHFPFTFDDAPWKRSSIEDYSTVVKRTDAAIGRLLASLASLPDAADIAVVVTADHGEEFGEHGAYFHGFTLYEPGVRVPIIAWSPIDHRRFFPAAPPLATAQLAEYLLAAIGAPADPDAAPSAEPGVLLRSVMLDHQFGVVSDGWKLIFNATRNTIELFDLRRDPCERHNLAAQDAPRVQLLGKMLGSLLSPNAWGASAPAAKPHG